MPQTQTEALIRAVLEEELGEFRPFAALTAAEIEAMAARLARVLAPALERGREGDARRSAA